MNKSDLIDAVARDSGLTKADAERALTAIVKTITGAVAGGDAVTLVGFGTFKASPRAARTGKNPKTGEALSIAATVAPTFKAGATFKAAVAKK